MTKRLSRRRFLQASAVAGTGVFLTHGYELSQARPPGPNARLHIGIIGAGGRGGQTIGAFAGAGTLVALCDVDEHQAAESFGRYPNATKYKDFRVMLDKQKDIDAVVVSTPDHTHAVAAITAMKMGKHVYVEKPLTHDIYEARQMKEVAAKQKVVTQMGNQGTDSNNLRQAVEVDPCRRHRRRDRSPRLDRSAQLAAEHRSAEENRSGAQDAGLGTVAGHGSRTSLCQQHLRPVQMAWLVGLRHRRPGRHGLPHDEPAVHGPASGDSNPRQRGNRHALERGDSAPRAPRLLTNFRLATSCPPAA